MNTEIQQPTQAVVPLFTEYSEDVNARRYMWSAAVTEDVTTYRCGHENINRMGLMPIDTFDSIIPTEVPARWVDSGGLESDIISPMGSRFFTYTEPVLPGAVFGTQPVTQTGLRKTAAQLVHDMTFGLNTLESRGIGEITAFRGQFKDTPGELSKLYAIILPVEHRKTLKKAIAWLQGSEAEEACSKNPVARKALPEFRNLALEAEMFLMVRIDKAEAEVKQYHTTGEGKRRLDEFDKLCLRELERTEASLIPGKQQIEGNAALGKEMAGAFLEGLKVQQGDQAASLANAQNAELRAEMAEMKKLIKDLTKKPAKEAA